MDIEHKQALVIETVRKLARKYGLSPHQAFDLFHDELLVGYLRTYIRTEAVRATLRRNHRRTGQG